MAHKYESKERTSDVDSQEKVSFADMHLSPPVLAGLNLAGYTKPSPIQLEAIPIAKCGKDVVIQSKSGTGKTLVFGVVALEAVDARVQSPQVLVLAPTREIAFQNAHVIVTIGSQVTGLDVRVFIGGMPLETDRTNCKSCHVAVGTPGRVRQLVDGGFLKTRALRLLVLDEADKLMEDAFIDDVTWIFCQLPLTKQVMAVSATYPEALAALVSRYTTDPAFIRPGQQRQTLVGVKQVACRVAYHPLSQQQAKNKLDVLLHLLQAVAFSQCIVFTNLQTRAESLAAQLSVHGHGALSISAGQTQTKRLQTLLKLRQFQCKVLVATDLAARGIDAEHVDLVVHVDVPRDAATYLHRVGRAGRFGAVGLSACLACEGDELTDLRAIITRTAAQVRVFEPELHLDASAPTPAQLFDATWTGLTPLEGTGLDVLADVDAASKALLPRNVAAKNKTKTKSKHRDRNSFKADESAAPTRPDPEEAARDLSIVDSISGLCIDGVETEVESTAAQQWQDWYHSWRSWIGWNKAFLQQSVYLDAMTTPTPSQLCHAAL